MITGLFAGPVQANGFFCRFYRLGSLQYIIFTILWTHKDSIAVAAQFGNPDREAWCLPKIVLEDGSEFTSDPAREVP